MDAHLEALHVLLLDQSLESRLIQDFHFAFPASRQYTGNSSGRSSSLSISISAQTFAARAPPLVPRYALATGASDAGEVLEKYREGVGVCTGHA